MRKWISLLIAIVLTMSVALPAIATEHADNDYTLSTEGAVVLQNAADRNIKLQTPPVRNPIIAGESPTTGMSWIGFYLPMIAQFSNAEGTMKVNGKTVPISFWKFSA